jgi:hypothetical protein
LNRREIDLAGDVRTMPEAAEILTEALGRPIAFTQTPIEQVRQYSKEMALMLEWFERGYSADIAGLEREFGRPLTNSPTGHVAVRGQVGKEVSHESCQIVGIRWAVGIQRCTDADASPRRDPGQDQEYRRQSSGSC